MDILKSSWPELLRGAEMTVMLGVVSFVLGCVLGALVAAARLAKFRLLRMLAFMYVSIFRGTPLLVQIFIVYFGLPQLGITLSAVPSVIIALTLFSASYLSENFRSGILAVDKGQWEAAASIALPIHRTLTRVIFPQALRVAVPSVGGRFIALMKDTSLASVVTVVELTHVADAVGTATFRYMQAFIVVGIIYWMINAVLSLGQMGLERRLGVAYK